MLVAVVVAVWLGTAQQARSCQADRGRALDLARAGRELRARLVGQAGAVAGILTALATPPRPGHPTVLIMLGQVWF